MNSPIYQVSLGSGTNKSCIHWCSPIADPTGKISLPLHESTIGSFNGHSRSFLIDERKSLEYIEICVGRDLVVHIMKEDRYSFN